MKWKEEEATNKCQDINQKHRLPQQLGKLSAARLSHWLRRQLSSVCRTSSDISESARCKIQSDKLNYYALIYGRFDDWKISVNKK